MLYLPICCRRARIVEQTVFFPASVFLFYVYTIAVIFYFFNSTVVYLLKATSLVGFNVQATDLAAISQSYFGNM